jgi:hypothetical protein
MVSEGVGFSDDIVIGEMKAIVFCEEVGLPATTSK